MWESSIGETPKNLGIRALSDEGKRVESCKRWELNLKDMKRVELGAEGIWLQWKRRNILILFSFYTII